MFHQASVLVPQGEASIQGKMVPLTRGLPRYLVDDIVKETTCTLLVPFGRSSRKKEVGRGVAMPPRSGTMYDNKPMPPDYAMLLVTWTNPEFEDHEIDIPTPHGLRYMRAILGEEVLWNKDDIILDNRTPVSQPSEPSSSTADDNDDYGGDDDNDIVGQGSSPPPGIAVHREV